MLKLQEEDEEEENLFGKPKQAPFCPSQLKELSNEEEQRTDRRLRLGCVVQLSFPQHGQTSRGTAVLEDSFTQTGDEEEDEGERS